MVTERGGAGGESSVASADAHQVCLLNTGGWGGGWGEMGFDRVIVVAAVVVVVAGFELA